MNCKNLKRYLASICLLAISFNATNAQSLEGTNMDAIEKAVACLAKTFCGYVVAVGTTPGQVGAVSDDRKVEIIRDCVPSLFWDYYEAPRYMITTNGHHGEKQNKRKMSDYFLLLKAQSKNGLNSARRFELRFDGIVVNGDTSHFQFERVLSDGCELWSTTIRIKQAYYIIDLNSSSADGRVEEKIEKTVKECTVYLINKPNGKTGVYLGDVKRTYNE